MFSIDTHQMAGRAQEIGRRKVARIQEKPPKCLIVLRKAYHKYGMKHLVLMLVFMLYTIFGALLFLAVEKPQQTNLKDTWQRKIETNRAQYIEGLMRHLFNNSEFLIYVKYNTSQKLRQHFNVTFAGYEKRLGIRFSEQRMEWNFFSALLFAGTLCTTIGYGHIYPMTSAGKILTMIYALFGIPLMLLVLQDMGKLLTIGMKYPWFQVKRLGRRIFRCCTKQPLREMREIEQQERRDLEIFDLPLVVGVSLVFLWVWLCSTVMSVLDTSWTFLESFYFFFVSLSTIGLGDLVPHEPQLLIIMFGFIIIGLSLVSMVVNLLQTKMRKTYEAGKDDLESLIGKRGTSLGVLQVFEDIDEKKEKERDEEERSMSRSTQTSLSLPSARQVVLRSDGVHWIEEVAQQIKSPDEVTQLVEMESGLAVCQQIADFNKDEETDLEEEMETDRLLISHEKEEDM